MANLITSDRFHAEAQSCNEPSQSHTTVTSTHTYVHTYMNTHHLPSSILFMSSPSSFIRGLPCTPMITSHTVIKASLVHFCLKRSWRISFFWILSCLRLISLSSPCAIMFLRLSLNTMSLASTSLINRSRKWSRTCSTAQIGESCYTQPANIQCSLLGHPPPTVRRISGVW